MRRFIFVYILIVLLATLSVAGTTTVTPTTTLAAETSNNTSAADSFATQTNGNTAPANVSKMSVHTLMPAGSTTQLYAHFMGWFGQSSHMYVGYNSHDPAQVTRQINDMVSRGMDGMVIEWYGQGSYEDNTALLVKPEVEKHPGFLFYINIDVGTLQWHSPCFSAGTCTAAQAINQQISYVRSTYFPSPNYNKINGRPVMGEFGMSQYTVDWNAVQAANPDVLMLHRNTVGYTRPATAGGYSWLGSRTTDYATYEGLDYLNNFYSVSKTYPNLLHWGSVYKGFDDTLASWGSNRHIAQLCGKTWLDAWGVAAQQPAGLLYAMQLVTWNDYEEGTEFETGIDGCTSLTATASGSQLSWSLTGDPATLDHYNVFISSDGSNLMKLTSLPVTQNALDLSTFGLAAGSYTVYVQGYSKPAIQNTMSNPASFSVNAASPVVTLSLTPTSGVAPQVVAATATASDPDGTVTSTTIDFGDGSVPMNGNSGSHQYAAAGTYTVTATATDNLGLSTKATQQVNIASNQPPLAALSLTPGSGYSPLAVSASTANSTDPDGTVASSSIDFGDGSSAPGPTASHTYTTPGTRTVTATVTDNKGATSTATGTVTVNGVVVTINSPAANATVVSPVRVTGSGSPAAGVIDTQLWIDGVKQADVPGAVLDYTLPLAPGQHRIVVLCNDSANNPFKTVEYVTVDAPPVAALSVTPASGIAPVTVTASTASSTDSDGTIASSSIDFGDGTVLPGPTATHAYTTAGAKIITATVTDNVGATATASANVTVSANQPPVAALSVTPTSGIAPVTVTASTANSTDADGTIASSSINFGDGTVLPGPTATHTYSTAGTKTITATVTDNLGATATASATVTVSANQPPVAALSVTPTSGTAPVTVTASTATSTDSDGTIASSSINFGDGTVLPGPTATHIYSTAGTKTIIATVTDNLGATATASATVNVTAANQPPRAVLSVTPTSGIAPLAVTASTAGSSDPDGSIASQKIDFGDGTSAGTVSASHTYVKVGSYTITATVTDNAGATASTSATVTAQPGVIVTSPLPGSINASPVHVVASAISAANIKELRVFVDGVSRYSTTASSMNAYVKMPKGTRTLVIQATDSAANVYKTSLVITVQ